MINEMITGKKAFNNLNTISDSRSSLDELRTFYISSVHAIMQKKAKLEERIKEINSTFHRDKALPMIRELQNDFDADVRMHRNKLTENLNAILEAKKEACQKYIMTPPSNDQLALINTIKLRGAENIPNEEWEMIINTLAGNYQAAMMLETIAKETQDKPTGKKDFVAPVTIASVNADLDLIKNWFEIAFNNIADPYESPRSLEMFKSDRIESPTSILIAKLDREIVSTVPSASLSTKNRLREAAQHALHVGQYELFNEINHFIFENISKLETPEETQREFAIAAEKLIEAGNNATENKKSHYEEHLDKVINDLKNLTGEKDNEP